MRGRNSSRWGRRVLLVTLLAGAGGCHTLKTQLAGGPNGSTTSDSTAVKHVQVFTSGKPTPGLLGGDDHVSRGSEPELVPDYSPKSRIAAPSFHWNDRYPSGGGLWASPMQGQTRHHPHS